jgi:sodium-dependent dicarboxylate transporter 2/3/5
MLVLIPACALLILATIAMRPRQILLGSMLATAGMSMWFSNPPAVLMMLSIEAAVIACMGVEAGSFNAPRPRIRG